MVRSPLDLDVRGRYGIEAHRRTAPLGEILSHGGESGLGAAIGDGRQNRCEGGRRETMDEYATLGTHPRHERSSDSIRGEHIDLEAVTEVRLRFIQHGVE